MKTSEIIRKSTLYTSSVVPSISSEQDYDGETIAWADTYPVVWKIVMGTKSKAFGKGSSDYMGCGRDDSSSSVIYRAAHFRSILRAHTDPPRAVDDSARARGDFWTWRANFTLTHYADKGFRGGFFQQFDGTYDRGCVYLDYTPATLDEVIERFLAWCNSGPCRYDTVAVKLDKKVVRTLGTQPEVGAP
jgi:hypothetical protein